MFYLYLAGSTLLLELVVEVSISGLCVCVWAHVLAYRCLGVCEAGSHAIKMSCLY